jgi:AcrR family transcriptional regulator
MPKIVDKEKMVKSIMASALQAFIKHGFHKITMDKIAKEAGIAKGTLYLYFDSKQSLSHRIITTHFEELNKKLMCKTDFHSLDSLLSHIEGGLFISEEELQFVPVFFGAFGSVAESKSLKQEISVFFDNSGKYYAQQLQSLVEQKVVDSRINPTALGWALTCMLDGILMHKSLFELSESRYNAMIKETISLYRRGLINMEQ